MLKKPSLDLDILANYRPVIDLPFISKILEKVVASQFGDHLYKNDVFEVFRINHSTEMVLVRITKDLLMASDNGLVFCLQVLLDLSAAFVPLITSNFLLLNLDKKEVIVFHPKHFKNGIADFMLVSSTTVRNLLVIFDQDVI